MSAPPPPWRCRVEGVLWWHRAAPAAASVLPAALRRRRVLPLTVGGMLAYRDGPVGAYAEVLGIPLLLAPAPGLAHVAFMAVDSAASAAGGRANWALPKEPAAFAGAVGRPGEASARGGAWALALTTAARPRALPAAARATCAQVWPDGIVRAFGLRFAGRARLGSVEVRHDVPSALAAWLRSGRHPAVLVSGSLTVGPPRP